MIIFLPIVMQGGAFNFAKAAGNISLLFFDFQLRERHGFSLQDVQSCTPTMPGDKAHSYARVQPGSDPGHRHAKH